MHIIKLYSFDLFIVCMGIVIMLNVQKYQIPCIFLILACVISNFRTDTINCPSLTPPHMFSYVHSNCVNISRYFEWLIDNIVFCFVLNLLVSANVCIFNFRYKHVQNTYRVKNINFNYQQKL